MGCTGSTEASSEENCNEGYQLTGGEENEASGHTRKDSSKYKKDKNVNRKYRLMSLSNQEPGKNQPIRSSNQLQPGDQKASKYLNEGSSFRDLQKELRSGRNAPKE